MVNWPTATTIKHLMQLSTNNKNLSLNLKRPQEYFYKRHEDKAKGHLIQLEVKNERLSNTSSSKQP